MAAGERVLLVISMRRRLFAPGASRSTMYERARGSSYESAGTSTSRTPTPPEPAANAAEAGRKIPASSVTAIRRRMTLVLGSGGRVGDRARVHAGGGVCRHDHGDGGVPARGADP